MKWVIPENIHTYTTKAFNVDKFLVILIVCHERPPAIFVYNEPENPLSQELI